VLRVQTAVLGLYRTVAVGRMQVAAASAGGSLTYDVIMLSARGGGSEVSLDESAKHGGQFPRQLAKQMCVRQAKISGAPREEH